MNNLHVVEDISSKGTKWYLAYEDPIDGERFEITENDAMEIRAMLP